MIEPFPVEWSTAPPTGEQYAAYVASIGGPFAPSNQSALWVFLSLRAIEPRLTPEVIRGHYLATIWVWERQAKAAFNKALEKAAEEFNEHVAPQANENEARRLADEIAAKFKIDPNQITASMIDGQPVVEIEGDIPEAFRSVFREKGWLDG